MIYCGKCLNNYTRKETWENHYNFQKYRVDRKHGGGYAENICYDPDNKETIRVYDVTEEKAKQKYQLALKSREFFKVKPSKRSASEPADAANSDVQSAKKPNISSSSVSSEVEVDFTDKGESRETSLYYPDSDDDDEVIEVDEGNDDGDLGDFLDTDTDNLDKVFDMLQAITKRQIDNHADITNQIKSIKTVSTPVSKPETTRNRSVPSITADEQFAQNMLSLKYAESMDEVLNNPLIKDSFKLSLSKSGKLVPGHSGQSDENVEPNVGLAETSIGTEVDQDLSHTDDNKSDSDESEDRGVWVLYCLCCSDKSLRSQQGMDLRVSSFKVKNPKFSNFDNKTRKKVKLPKWFSNLKIKLRVHCRHISHHQLSTCYNMLYTRRFQNAAMIRRMRLNIIYFLLRTNSSFTLYPILLAVLSRCGNEVGNYNSSRHVMPKILKLIGKSFDL